MLCFNWRISFSFFPKFSFNISISVWYIAFWASSLVLSDKLYPSSLLSVLLKLLFIDIKKSFVLSYSSTISFSILFIVKGISFVLSLFAFDIYEDTMLVILWLFVNIGLSLTIWIIDIIVSFDCSINSSYSLLIRVSSL